MADRDWNPGGSRTPMVAGFAVAQRHGRGQHAIAMIKQVLPGQDGDFLPAVPVNFTSPGENRVQPRLIERDVFSCVFKELRKLAALVFKELLGRPVLAFEQHFVEIFFQ